MWVLTHKYLLAYVKASAAVRMQTTIVVGQYACT